MELLPLLEGWMPESRLETAIPPIQPNDVWRIGPFKYSGWIRCILGTVNNPFASLEHNVFVRPQATTPYALYAMGVITPPPHGAAWLYKYDTVNSIYTIAWAPLPPQEFRSGMEITIRAPNKNPLTGAPITTPTTISFAWYYVIFIDDPDKFRKSLKDVLGISDLLTLRKDILGISDLLAKLAPRKVI